MEPEFLSVNAPSLDFLQADLRAGGIQNAAGDPGFIFVMPEFVDSGPGDSSASFTLRYSIGSAEISGATFTLLGVETAGNGSVQVTGTVEERSGLGRTFNFALGQDATDEQLVETIDVVGGYDVTLQVTVEAENPGDFARFSSLVNTTSVPEPSTVAALFGALSLLVVAGFRWKKATRRPRG
ncbi:MAG: PEP-CTERM sorting domain-containing protein [Opitutales bacterium]